MKDLTKLLVPTITQEPQFEDICNLTTSKLKGDIDALEKRAWKIPIRNGEVKVKDLIEKSVHVLAGAKDFIGVAVSTNPQAALAWSAVCFGLQVTRTPLIFLTSPQPKP
jgi:hypothetical protein